jgi:hypothetical protein
LKTGQPVQVPSGQTLGSFNFLSKDFKAIGWRPLALQNLFRDPTIWCYPKQIKNQPATFVLEPPCARCVFPRGRPSQFSVNSQWFHPHFRKHFTLTKGGHV